MKQFDFPSSTSDKTYHTLINDNGLLSCDCPGWTVKRLGKVRECKHTKKIALDEGLILEERDGQWFVVGSGKDSPTHSPSSRPIPERPIPERQGFISPMLASAMPEGKTADSFAPDPKIAAIMRGGLPIEWVMEEKFDGHRLIVRVEEEIAVSKHPELPDLTIKTVTAWSRLGNKRTLPFHIHELVLDMPVGVYDGELIVPGSQHSYSVTAGQNSGTEAFVLFDMLEVHGKSVMAEPFHTRRACLEIAFEIFDNLSTDKLSVFLADQFPPSMAKVQEIWDRGGEGAILKKLSAKYSPGWRSPDWIKVKAVLSATLLITGFKSGKNGPYSIVELRDDHGIETTVKTLNNDMMRQFQQNPTAYIGKKLVISYHERMPKGKYRHPMFDHLAGVGE